MNLSIELFLFVVFLCVPAVAIYLLIRNQLVFNFRKSLNQICYDWSTRHLYEPSAYQWCMWHVASYNEMVLSFKRLTLENWLTEEMIEKLKS